ncbi:MAG: hypothetical protein R3C30_09465 [Hyphomonadaceae bacterium]
MPYGFHDESYSRLSNLLTADLAATGAKSLAATYRAQNGQPRLLATSAGTSLAFVELCLGLAEAPQPGGIRELEVEGLGYVMWQASGDITSDDAEVLLFALRDQGRLTQANALLDRLRRLCEPEVN